MIHFVGFRGNEFWSAVKIFGQPDFFHRVFDQRAKAEFMDGDVVVFANGVEDKFSQFVFDDSAAF